MRENRVSFKLRYLTVAMSFSILGIVLNRLVIWLNSGMPTTLLRHPTGIWIPLTKEIRLTVFADIIPTLDSSMSYYSIGDLLMWFGMLIYAVIASNMIYNFIRNRRKKLTLEW